MPSPTRTITPAQSPVQTKRKLQLTVSTENAAGTTAKKKEKPSNSSFVISEATAPLTEETPMETEGALVEEPPPTPAAKLSANYSKQDLLQVGDLCDQLLQNNGEVAPTAAPAAAPSQVAASAAIPRQPTRAKLDAVVETPEEKDATKVIKKFVNKHKTADLVNAITANSGENNAQNASNKSTTAATTSTAPAFVRKCSLQDESTLNKFNADRRKSRILETAEKFQQMGPAPTTAAADKSKKTSVPGVSVGSFKKEFERKASNATPVAGPTPGERRALEQVAAAAAAAQEAEAETLVTPPASPGTAAPDVAQSLESSDSKNSVASLSLDEARRSMENSIALLLQAQNESSKELDQLCAQTETIGVSEPTEADRERKLKNARTIIGNAIQPASPGGDPNAPGAVKTSTASITLKSATLPRRKINAKSEVQLDIKPRIVEQPAMRFTTEMQHPVADLRSAPPREGPLPYSPIKTSLHARATSLEPKEHIIPVQRPPQHAYARTVSNTTNRSGSLSRQSTVESESDATTTNLSQSTLTGGMSMSGGAPAQPIKKSPREFIIPIAVEGGGFITPRERSVEPSESSHTTASSRTTFSRLRPSRGIGSLLSEAGFDEGSPFQKMRTTSITRDGGDDDVRFTPHILRSSRPVKKISQDNDSQSSGEEDDDDDGFEILTAENLFSTLLQRVRALTNRLNVNSDLTTGFPSHSSRLLTDISRQAQNSPFWSRGSAFGSRLNSGSNSSGLGAPWRHSMSRDLGSDMDSMFSRTGATLPRGHAKNSSKKTELNSAIAEEAAKAVTTAATGSTEEPLDLADLDLSRLRLSKKDLETLSSITPGLPKCFQEQLLAKLPPTQARKLSRTLSVQTSVPAVKVYKRSQSSGRGYLAEETQQEARQEARQESRQEARQEAQQEAQQPTKQPPLTDAPKTTAASTAIYRRSLSRTRYEGESAIPAPPSLDNSNKSRSSSVCRDDYAKSSLCNSSYTSDINDKYKYYSPYLSKSSNAETTGLQERYSAALGRPPSGCLSPPPTQANTMPISDGTSSLRGRSSQRRISRFLRPDFFDEPATPSAGDENAYQRERRQRERETQSVLREIREKSCDRQLEESTDLRRRKHSLPNVEAELNSKSTRHARNKSMEMFADEQTKKDEASKSLKRRSLSRPRDMETELDKHQLADKILQELQLLSAVRTQHEKRLSNELVVTEEAAKNDKTEQSYSEQTATIKKIKKVKPKEKSQESSTDADNTLTNTTTTTTLVRKVKKAVKKSDGIKTPTGESVPTLSAANEQLKETKIKRPKSYPMKDVALSLKTADVPECAPTALPSKLPSKLPTASMALVEPNADNNATASLRESRLIRPKSYPATKLSTPKELKKVTRSGVAIPSIAETAPAASFKSSSNTSRQSTSEEKSLSATPTGNSATNEKDSSSSSESRPTTIKKIIKISKKSKLVPPTPVTPTTPTTTTTSVSPAESSKESSPVIKAKEKSPEKKPSKGLLYAIGQKFEKLRDSAMSKEKKAALAAASMPNTPSSAVSSSCRELQSPEKVTMLRKKKSLDGEKQLNEAGIAASGAEGAATEKRNDKRSRFDTMLRSLRERSVPRAQSNAKEKSEASALKRAASVENLDGGKQGGAMNKMLGGLFRRFDRESSEQRRVRSTRSTSNIERQIREETPTSPIYQNAAAIASVKATKSKANIEENCNCETACPDCIQNQTIKQSKELTTITQSNKEKRKGLMLDLAKLERLDNVSANPTSTTGGAASTTTTTSSYRSAKTNSTLLNGNGLYSNLPPYPGAIKSASNNSSSQQSMDNVTNNNSINTNNNSSSMHTSQTSGYRTSSAHEINRNTVQTPSFENIANYSSDSRSYQDDCASTSTFLSPTEEPELYFDNWSICSEDNYMLHATPSPTVSRLSRASQLSSPTRCSESSDPNESVIDRIKRRSFYSRFNEQKPRRTSSIVGPVAVRDFYREQQAAIKARSSHKLHADVDTRAHSPDITQQFFRPLKLSPVGTELKPPVYRSPLDYSASSVSSKPRKSLNDIRTNTSPSFLSKRYGSSSMDQHEYNSTLSSTVPMRYKSSSSSSPSNGAVGGTAASNYYNTYNPKRRSSYTLNGSVPTGSGSSAATSSHIDGYATLGRRSIRPYDHRTMSLLEPPTNSSAGSSSGYHRREARTPVRDYTSSISRSGSRYRTSSATRSPTNI